MKQNKRTLLTCTVLATSVLALAGCGGGGDSSSKSTGAALQLDSEGYSKRAAQLYTSQDYEAVSASYGTMSEAQLLIDDVTGYLGAFSAASVGDFQAAAYSETYFCDNVGGVLVVSSDFNATAEWGTYTFSNCQVYTNELGDIVLDGTYSYRYDLVSANKVTGYDRYDIGGAVLSSGDPLWILGRQNYSMTMIDDTTWSATLSSDALEYRIGSDYVALVNMVTNLNYSETLISTAMGGKLVSSEMNGAVQISTPETVEILTEAPSCPSRGIFRFVGDGKVEVQYGESTNTAYAMAVVVNDSDVTYFDSCTGDVLIN